MIIGFISRTSLEDKTAWSGTINSLAKIIATEYKVEPIIVRRNIFDLTIRYIGKKLSIGTLKRAHLFCWLERLILRYKIKKSNCDVIFCPINSDLLTYGKIQRDKKLIYLSDATYHAMLNYYYFNESKKDEYVGNFLEKYALDRADAVIHSSHWAKKDAISFYNIAPNKLYVLPFSSNLNDKYQKKIYPKNKTEYKLLLVGVDSVRKGVDLAVDCVKYVNTFSDRIRFDLTVVGIANMVDMDSSIHYLGRLDKNVSTDMETIIRCYQEADIFILPTRAECSSIAWCEANMYGLPIFTHKTGGVDDYVLDGINGRCLPLGASGKDFAESILEAIDSGNLQKYSDAARKKYEEELNWSYWLKGFNEIVNTIGGNDSDDELG